MSSVTARTAYMPLQLPERLEPTPIVGLTRGKVAEAEAQRELTAMIYRYLRNVDRMRTGRTAR